MMGFRTEPSGVQQGDLPGLGHARAPWILAGLLMLLLLAGLTHQLWHARQEAVRNAEQTTRTLTVLLEQRMSSDFDRLDALLLFASEAFSPLDITLMSAAARAEQSSRLARLVLDFPEVAGAYVFDAEGALLLSSSPDTAPFSIADRSHFLMLRDQPGLSTVFTGPFVTRATGKQAIVQSRAVRDVSGRFMGIVNVLYHLDALTERIGRVDIGSGGITLLRSTETFSLIARQPALDGAELDQALPADDPVRLSIEGGAREGFVQFRSTQNGHRCLGFFRVLERHPFYVQVTFSEADYLADWQRQAWLVVGVLLLLGVPVLIMLFRLEHARTRERLATGKWLAEQKLVAESEALLRRVIDTMPHIVIVKNAEGRFELVNATLARLYESTPEAMVGKDDGDFNPNREQVEFYRRNIRDIIAAGMPQVVTEESTDVATGRVRRYQSVKVPFAGRDGAPSVLIVATDITDLYETEARLRASEERMTYAFAATREGLWDWSIVEDRVDHNNEWGRILGFTDPPSSHPVSFFAERIHVDDRAGVMARIGKALETDCDYISEHRLVWPDGRIVWVHDRGRVVVRDDSGAPLRMVGSIRDITDRKQDELALIEAKQAAEAANVAKSRFLATMSHEIRTPMNGLLGMAQMLLSTSMTDVERQSCLKTILSSGQTLMALLNDILDLSKVEAGKLSLDIGVVEPLHVLNDMQALFLDSAKAKGLDIEVVWIGAAGSCYRTDPHRLRQMLANLLNNAIKFTHQGGIRLTAHECTDEDGLPWLEFAVSDTGIGISEDQLDVLFRPFSQADNSTSRQFGGTGLGLSIVSSLAKLMNGEVGVESRPGEGSRFWFRIPVEAVIADELASQTVLDHVSGFSVKPFPRMQGRLLIVEDTPANQWLLHTLLSKAGIQTTLAENGQEAVSRFIEQDGHFDVIIMDIEMPVMDGFEAAERIRAWEASSGRARVPILAISADAFSKERVCKEDAAMDGFIAKPILFQDLLSALAPWLHVEAPESAAEQESPAAVARPLDAALFLELARSLLPMLEQGRFDALDCFAELEAMAAGSPLDASLSQIRRLLDEFRFEQACVALVALCDGLTEQGTGP